MKKATEFLCESNPLVEKHYNKSLEAIENLSLTNTDKTLLNLVKFFEAPDNNSFDIKEIYLNLSDDWLLLALEAIQIFFHKDTYLVNSYSKGDLLFERGKNQYEKSELEKNLLTQKRFSQFLSENGLPFSEAKVSTYIKRGTFPEADVELFNKKYWKKETCEMYLKELKNAKS